jgi:hypothetical protein
MDILTKTISLVFERRSIEIPHIAAEAPLVQRKQLTKLLSAAAGTEYGRKFDFSSIRSYEQFAERVPLSSYDDLKPYISRMINGESNILWPSLVKWFAKSSGTTNDKSKFLPVTKEILHHCHYQGGFDCLAMYLRNTTDSHFFSKKSLILGGSHSPSPLNNEAHQGDLSAVMIENLPSLANMLRVPSRKIVLMDEWESKIKAIVEGTCHRDIVSLSGVPSWMLVLIKAVMRHCGATTLDEVWPNLEVFFHGGISFEPYRDTYKELIKSPRMHYMETYNASEGFFALQDDPFNHSMLIMPDYGIFYEFIPFAEEGSEQPVAVPLSEVKKDSNYAVVITTCGGLWRYRLGDTIRFTSVNPYKFVITGRTKNYINAFGEELMVDNADKAIAETCRITGATVKEFTAAPLFLLGDAKGRHQWFIEFEKQPESIKIFSSVLDESLKELNSDYEAKRYKEISLQPPEIIVAREGSFYEWMRRNDKLGGQHKVPRLFNDRSFIEALIRINEE